MPHSQCNHDQNANVEDNILTVVGVLCAVILHYLQTHSKDGNAHPMWSQEKGNALCGMITRRPLVITREHECQGLLFGAGM